MQLLQGNHNMFCDIHIFFATTTTAEALLLSIQELTIVKCVVFLYKESFVWLFHAKIKFCMFFCGTMHVTIFFRSSVSATKLSMKVFAF